MAKVSATETTALLDTLTIVKCRELLESRQLTSADLVGMLFDRLEASEPFVHAYVSANRAEALAAARRLDEERASGQIRGTLHGLPLSVKDVFHVQGTLTRAGSRAYEHAAPDTTASAVQRCLDAGAFVMGKLVTHEFALGQDEPETRNAWNLEHYPGGSSAGAGVAVAVGSALAALGTDSAGSVRKPAALNGVVGFKPTYGAVATDGVVALSPSLDHVGTFTRTAEDCRLLFDVLAPATAQHHAAPPSAGPVDLTGARIGVCPYFSDSDHVWPAVQERFSASLERLRSGGAQIVEITMPSLRPAVAAGFIVMAAEAAAVHAARLRERGSLYSTPTRVLLEAASLLPATFAERAQQVRELIRRSMYEAFTGHSLDALISPTVPRTSMRLADMVPDRDLAEYIRNTVVANLTGQPAVTLPCGLTGDALPVGVQLTGVPYRDRELLNLAGLVEEAIADGFQAAPGSWTAKESSTSSRRGDL